MSFFKWGKGRNPLYVTNLTTTTSLLSAHFHKCIFVKLQQINLIYKGHGMID